MSIINSSFSSEEDEKPEPIFNPKINELEDELKQKTAKIQKLESQLEAHRSTIQKLERELEKVKAKSKVMGKPSIQPATLLDAAFQNSQLCLKIWYEDTVSEQDLLAAQTATLKILEGLKGELKKSQEEMHLSSTYYITKRLCDETVRLIVKFPNNNFCITKAKSEQVGNYEEIKKSHAPLAPKTLEQCRKCGQYSEVRDMYQSKCDRSHFFHNKCLREIIAGNLVCPVDKVPLGEIYKISDIPSRPLPPTYPPPPS